MSLEDLTRKFSGLGVASAEEIIEDQIALAQSAKPLSTQQLMKRDLQRDGLNFTPNTNMTHPTSMQRVYTTSANNGLQAAQNSNKQRRV